MTVCKWERARYDWCGGGEGGARLVSINAHCCTSLSLQVATWLFIGLHITKTYHREVTEGFMVASALDLSLHHGKMSRSFLVDSLLLKKPGLDSLESRGAFSPPEKMKDVRDVRDERLERATAAAAAEHALHSLARHQGMLDVCCPWCIPPAISHPISSLKPSSSSTSLHPAHPIFSVAPLAPQPARMLQPAAFPASDSQVSPLRLADRARMRYMGLGTFCFLVLCCLVSSLVQHLICDASLPEESRIIFWAIKHP